MDLQNIRTIQRHWVAHSLPCMFHVISRREYGRCKLNPVNGISCIQVLANVRCGWPLFVGSRAIQSHVDPWHSSFRFVVCSLTPQSPALTNHAWGMICPAAAFEFHLSHASSSIYCHFSTFRLTIIIVGLSVSIGYRDPWWMLIHRETFRVCKGTQNIYSQKLPSFGGSHK